MNKSRLLSAACACLALSSTSLSAAIITYSYTGSISSMYEAECLPDGTGGCSSYTINNLTTSSFYLNEVFSVDDTFTGYFSYDTNSQLSGISNDGYQGVYLDGVIDYGLILNSFNAPTPSFPSTGHGALSIVNGRSGTDVFQTNSNARNNDWFSIVTVSLQDNTGTVFDNFTIPDTLDPTSFHYLGFRLAFLRQSDGDQLQISGNITSLALVTVPLPPALWLFATGLLGLIGVARRKVY